MDDFQLFRVEWQQETPQLQAVPVVNGYLLEQILESGTECGVAARWVDDDPSSWLPDGIAPKRVIVLADESCVWECCGVRAELVADDANVKLSTFRHGVSPGAPPGDQAFTFDRSDWVREVEGFASRSPLVIRESAEVNEEDRKAFAALFGLHAPAAQA